jgi:hypothetical protein
MAFISYSDYLQTRPEYFARVGKGTTPEDEYGNALPDIDFRDAWVKQLVADPNLVKIRPVSTGEGSASKLFYKDGTTKTLTRKDMGSYLYYVSPDLVKAESAGPELDRFTFADGTTEDALSSRVEAKSGNFFESGNWIPPVIAVGGAAMLGTAAYEAYGLGVLGAEAGAAATFTPEELALTANSVNFGGEGALGIGGAGSTAAAGTVGNAALGVGTEISKDIGTAVSNAAAQSGTTLTAEQSAAATAKVAAAKAAAEAAGKIWTAGDYLKAASLAITAGTTIAAIAGGGDTTVTGTTTTDTRPVTVQEQALKDFDNYIDNYYGLNAGGKSVETRIGENVAGQKAAEQTFTTGLESLNKEHLAGTTAAVSPYQKQLSDALSQSQTGTGYFKPFNYSFGGQAMPSFVPKQQLTAMNAALGTGRESSNIATGLEDLGYNAKSQALSTALQFAAAHPTNEAADKFTQSLGELMKYTNTGGKTETTTGTVPGVPWYDALLKGLNTGVNFYDKIYNPRTSSGITQAQLEAALKAISEGRA